MYNKIKRIGYLLSAVIILFFNIFVKCVPAFAAEVALEQSYVVINNWLSSAASNPNSNAFLTKALGAIGAAAGISALFGGDDPKEVTKDFINEYQNMQSANLNALVIEPAKFAKYLLWDKPQEYLPSDAEVVDAVKNVMNETGASLVVFADNATTWGDKALDNLQALGSDTYMFYSSALSSAYNSFLNSHSKTGLYYHNISDIPIYEYTGGDTVGNYFLFDIKAKSIDPYGRESYNYEYHYYRDTVLRGKLDNYRLCWRIYPDQWDDNHAGFFLQVYDANGKYNGANMAYYKEEYAGVNGHTKVEDAGNSFTFTNLNGVMPVFSTNIPIFYDDTSMNNFLKTGVANGAVNAPSIPENADLVLPKTSPDLTADHPYTLGDLEAIAGGYADVIDKVLEGVGEGAIDWPLTDGIAIDDGGAVSIPGVGTGENVGTIDLPVSIPYPVNVPWNDVIPISVPDNPAIDDPAIDDPAIDNPNIEDIDIDGDNGNPVIDLSNFFPFCLPHDFMTAIKLLAIEGEPPVFEIPLKYNVLGNPVEHTVVIDIMKPGTTKDNSNAIAYVKYLRWFQTIAFIIAMIFITIRITPH